MNRTRIKICGIRDVASARAAVEAGADAIGLVFVTRSPRCVGIDEARAIVASLPALVEPVGLFVNAPVAEVSGTAAAVGLRTVQLHGDEDAAYMGELAHLRLIKSLAYDAGYEPKRRAIEQAGVPLAGLLVDAPPPVGHAEGATGGHGRSFDWDALARDLRSPGAVRWRMPLILAGGLTPVSVARAIMTVQPYAVDVSSGVESSRGVKDAGMIAAFCEAVANADASRGNVSAL